MGPLEKYSARIRLKTPRSSIAHWRIGTSHYQLKKLGKQTKLKEITYFCLKLMGRENVKWPIQLHLPAPVLPSILPPSVSYDSRFPMAYCLWRITTFPCLFFFSSFAFLEKSKCSTTASVCILLIALYVKDPNNSLAVWTAIYLFLFYITEFQKLILWELYCQTFQNYADRIGSSSWVTQIPDNIKSFIQSWEYQF